MPPKRRRRGVSGAPLEPIRYININFPPSDAALYDAIKSEAKRRRQGASQYLRCLAEADLGLVEAEVAREETAMKGEDDDG